MTAVTFLLGIFPSGSASFGKSLGGCAAGRRCGKKGIDIGNKKKTG